MIRKVMALALALAVSSCSFTMTDPPAQPTVGVKPDCSTSRVLPTLDVLAAVTNFVYGMVFLAVSEDKEELLLPGLVGMGVAGLFTFSAVGGYGKARRCRAAEAAALPVQPYPYMPYPPPVPQQPPVYGYPGAERGVCRTPPEAPCDAGLTCASNRCVRF